MSLFSLPWAIWGLFNYVDLLIVQQVWSFSPPPEEIDDTVAIESSSSTPGIGSTDHSELMMHAHHRTVFSNPCPTIPPASDGDQPMLDATS